MLEPSKKLSYLLGLFQADGRLEDYTDKNGKRSFSLKMCTSFKSRPMVEKVQQISGEILNRHSEIRPMNTRPCISFHVGVGRYLESFKKLGIDFSNSPKPPFWVVEYNVFLGSYLAGVIDGDGDIRIKKKIPTMCHTNIQWKSSGSTC